MCWGKKKNKVVAKTRRGHREAEQQKVLLQKLHLRVQSRTVNYLRGDQNQVNQFLMPKICSPPRPPALLSVLCRVHIRLIRDKTSVIHRTSRPGRERHLIQSACSPSFCRLLAAGLSSCLPPAGNSATQQMAQLASKHLPSQPYRDGLLFIYSVCVHILSPAVWRWRGRGWLCRSAATKVNFFLCLVRRPTCVGVRSSHRSDGREGVRLHHIRGLQKTNPIKGKKKNHYTHKWYFNNLVHIYIIYARTYTCI